MCTDYFKAALNYLYLYPIIHDINIFIFSFSSFIELNNLLLITRSCSSLISYLRTVFDLILILFFISIFNFNFYLILILILISRYYSVLSNNEKKIIKSFNTIKFYDHHLLSSSLFRLSEYIL